MTVPGLARLCAIAMGCAVACLSVGSPAQAQEGRRARLLYDHDEQAAACPESDALSREIDARLGRPGIDQTASLVITIHVDVGSDQNLRALVRMWDGSQMVGERRLDGFALDCRALADAIVLAASLAIDPDLDESAPLRPAPAVATPVPEAITPPVASAPPIDDGEPWAPEASLAGTVTTAGPRTALGFETALLAARAPYAIGLAFRAQFATLLESGANHVDSTLLAGGAHACYRAVFLRMCLVANIGSFRATAVGFPGATTAADLYADIGARVVGLVHIASLVYVEPWIEGAVALARTNYLIGTDIAYQPSQFALTFGVSLSFHMADLSIP